MSDNTQLSYDDKVKDLQKSVKRIQRTFELLQKMAKVLQKLIDSCYNQQDQVVATSTKFLGMTHAIKNMNNIVYSMIRNSRQYTVVLSKIAQLQNVIKLKQNAGGSSDTNIDDQVTDTNMGQSLKLNIQHVLQDMRNKFQTQKKTMISDMFDKFNDQLKRRTSKQEQFIPIQMQDFVK